MRTSTKFLGLAIVSYVIGNFFDFFPLLVASYIFASIALFFMGRE